MDPLSAVASIEFQIGLNWVFQSYGIVGKTTVWEALLGAMSIMKSQYGKYADPASLDVYDDRNSGQTQFFKLTPEELHMTIEDYYASIYGPATPGQVGVGLNIVPTGVPCTTMDVPVYISIDSQSHMTLSTTPTSTSLPNKTQLLANTGQAAQPGQGDPDNQISSQSGNYPSADQEGSNNDTEGEMMPHDDTNSYDPPQIYNTSNDHLQSEDEQNWMEDDGHDKVQAPEDYSGFDGEEELGDDQYHGAPYGATY